jgi:hypothetical protein
MSAPRTVDPTGGVASTRFMGVRFTEQQLTQIEDLSTSKGLSKSAFLRTLLVEELNRVEKQG